jgi:serine protease AprX
LSNSLLNRWRVRLSLVLVAMVAPFALGGAAAHAAPSAQARLATVAKTAPARKVTAIVQFKPGFSERKATKLVHSHGGKITARVPLINGLAVKLSAKRARLLAREPQVIALTLNTRVHGTGIADGALATRFPRTIKADKVWRRGITGRGIGVAVIDTGVAGDVVDFNDAAGNSRVIANAVTSPGATTAGDGFGHGTHVAGLIAGNSLNRNPHDLFYGKYIGVAPDANIVAVKASDDAGNSTVLDVINGLQFVVDHKDEFNIRVVNLSLSSDTPQSYKTDPLDAAVEYAWQKGIVVIAASGNRGSAAGAVNYSPANDPFVISVGGTDENGNFGRSSRADWSSTGRTQDGILKPDVMAPGAHMVSVLAPSSAFLTLCSNCAIGGTYFKAGGTSMAAPVVAGAVALLLQARPTLTPDQVKTLLTQTDVPISGQAGAGQIDVERALLTPLSPAANVNRGVLPNQLIDAIRRAGIDISRWTRSSWSVATGALAASWARSSWSCADCAANGAAIDPTRSSWSKSSWSSAGEDASQEVALYADALEQAAEQDTLNIPIPVDAGEPAAPEAPAAGDVPAAPEPSATPAATAAPGALEAIK